MLEFGKVSGALSAVLIRRSQVLHYASRWGHHTRGISQGARLHLAALFWVTVLVAAVYALANIGERKRVSQAGIRTTLWLRAIDIVWLYCIYCFGMDSWASSSN